MKVPHPTTNSNIAIVINESYGFQVREVMFIPVGDMSYGYKVSCYDGTDFFLKLLDKKSQKSAIERANTYLPLLNVFRENGLFANAIHPVLNVEHGFKTETEELFYILFPWVEGKTLADAYPFSKSIIHQIAIQVATLHKTTSSVSEIIHLPSENFNLGFEQDLFSCLNILKSNQVALNTHGLALASLVLPRENDIRSLFGQIQSLQSSFKTNRQDFVLCHGDLWGGNIIQSSGGLCFIDWESVMLAPPEREMIGFIKQHLPDFVATYNSMLGAPFAPNVSLLRYYAFQAQLKNLTQWMMNILFQNEEEEQQKNDLEMIQFHCINRWQEIEEGLINFETEF
jgi:spectinomycin phosphotransferase